MIPDLLCIWLTYLLIRVCLVLRHWIELTHLHLVELPTHMDSLMLARLTSIVFCAWNWLQFALLKLELHLKSWPKAEQTVWIPEISYGPLGYS